MCVCASQSSLREMDVIPDQLRWKTLFHSEGHGKGAREAFRLSRGEQGGAAWAAELVLGWAVSTGSSDSTWSFTVPSASSLSQCRAGSPAPHPDITAQRPRLPANLILQTHTNIGILSWKWDLSCHQGT